MKYLLRAILALVALSIGVSAWWRWAVRRRELPCPAWLAWTLESPITETFASSRRILDRLALAPGMRVLDVGAGPGRLAIPAAQQVAPHGEVVALDMQSGMLEQLRARAAARGLTNLRTIQRPIGPGVLQPNTFDRALLVLVLGEIPDREAALREIFTALKPDGILSVTEMLPDPHYQRRATVRRLAEAAGFQLDRSYGNWVAFTLHFVKPRPGGGQAEL